MKNNEILWDRLSRLPKTLHPVIPKELTEDVNAARKQNDITIELLAAKVGVNFDMTRNVVYGNLKRVNYSVIRICNYLDININDYVSEVPDTDSRA